MEDLYGRIRQAAEALHKLSDVQPRAALILGTGLGGLAERINVRHSIPFSEVPHFPESTVEGHSGNLLVGTLGDVPVVALQGRFHHYEGYSLQQVTLPVRVFREIGAEYLFINSAAGGLNPHFQSSDVMAVTDHINLIPDNPLRGVTDERLGDRFPDMTRPYDKEMLRLASESALDLKIPLRLGVYVAVSGPSLETRAETRMLRMLGGDAVGMSSVPEVIVATQVGFKTLFLAAVTNVNLPDAMEPVSFERVLVNASIAEPKLARIVSDVLRRLPEKGR